MKRYRKTCRKASKHVRTTGRRKAPHRTYSRKFLPTGPATMVVQDGAIYFRLPRRLRSLNKLKTGIARYSDTQSWERLLEKARQSCDQNDLSIGPGEDCRMRLEIQRLSPSRAYYLDTVNLMGGCKGLEDALVRLGYLVDDNVDWEDGPHVSQELSEDKRYWTIVRITRAPALYQEASHLWPSKKLPAKKVIDDDPLAGIEGPIIVKDIIEGTEDVL